MFSFSENYQLRKYYLQERQVPTQSMIKRKMSPNLAAILFKCLNPKLKVLVGLEPPLKGGGSDWYVSPKEILFENRAVLKPLDHEKLTKLNHSGIMYFKLQTLTAHHKDFEEEKKNILLECDKKYEKISQECWNENVELHTKNNTNIITHAFDLFSVMYKTSLNNIETVIKEELVKDINKMQELTRLKMKNRYDTFCKSQAIFLNDEFTAKLKYEKARLKAEFIEHLETSRTEMADKIHDLNVDKHVAVEKLRKFLECQKLACQIYVSLKEKEKCFKEMEESKHKHEKNAKHLTDAFVFTNFEASLAEQKERKRQELNSIWLKKVSHVVKTFQMFVSYCLNTLPDHAEFFINIEKLMLLQVNEALEDPTAESIIAAEEEKFHTSVLKPKPYYLFCDKGYKAEVDESLCPKHIGTSSASDLQLPAIVVNKRCIYAACDNFERFTNKIEDYIHGNRGNDADIKDDLLYEHFVPVKYTSSQQLSEIKLESSLLQVLQQEMSNIEKMPLANCTISNCFCAPHEDTEKPNNTSEKITGQEHSNPLPSQSTSNKDPDQFINTTRLEHEREPKLERYLKYTEPKTCECTKRCKKHLAERLPVYMRKMSVYDAPKIPNYETCSVTTLKKLVKQARAERTPPVIVKISSKTTDMCTQYSDEEYDFLCTCFSHSNKDSFEPAETDDQFDFKMFSPSYMTSKPSSFAIDRAHSLRQLVGDAPELMEIFNKKK